MTSAEMLGRVRTLLDEASAAFFEDTEIYRALSDGQREVANMILTVYKANPVEIHEVLRPLVKNYTNGSFTGTIDTLQTDFLYPLSVRGSIDSAVASNRQNIIVRERSKDRYWEQDISYMQGEFCYFSNTQIVFDETFSSGSYDYDYISLPTEISASIQPILPSVSHNAIVTYAYSYLLGKDDRTAESGAEKSKFEQEVKGLV